MPRLEPFGAITATARPVKVNFTQALACVEERVLPPEADDDDRVVHVPLYVTPVPFCCVSFAVTCGPSTYSPVLPALSCARTRNR